MGVIQSEKIYGPLSQTVLTPYTTLYALRAKFLLMDVPPLESFTQCSSIEAVEAFGENIVHLVKSSLESEPRLENIILQRPYPDRIVFYLFTIKNGIFKIYQREIY